MKMFWIVTWAVSLWVSDPCPDAVKTEAQARKYGTSNSGSVCAVNHGHYETQKYIRVFYSEEEANAFTYDGPPGIDFEVTKSTTAPQEKLPEGNSRSWPEYLR